MKISYQLKQLAEDKYLFNYNFDYTHLDMSKENYQIGHSLSANSKDSEIILTVHVRIVSQDTVLVEDGVRAVFSVNPFDSLVTGVDNDGLQVSEPRLIATFVNVAIGALRGMLVKNLKGTPLESALLPLISMDIIKANTEQKKKASRQTNPNTTNKDEG